MTLNVVVVGVGVCLVLFGVMHWLAGRYGRLLAQVDILQRKLEGEKELRQEVARSVAEQSIGRWEELEAARDSLRAGSMRRQFLSAVLERYRLVQMAVGLPVIEGQAIDQEEVARFRRLFRLDEEE